MAKVRFSERQLERFFAAAAAAQGSEKSLPLQIREENVRSCRDIRIEELRRQYLTGTYYVPAVEIGAAIVEKHLKR